MVKVMKFGATWCAPCSVQEEILQEFHKEHPEIDVECVDVDENEILTIKYNIINVPTTIILKNEEEIFRHVGIVKKEELLKFI